MRKISTGVYVDDNNDLHLHIPEILQEAGYADTPENRAELVEVATKMFGDRFPDVPIRVVP